MSEAYLFATVQQIGEANAATALAEVLRSGGARASWLSEIHWVSPPTLLIGQPLVDVQGSEPKTNCFSWPDAPLIDHFVLHAVLRALQLGAFHLAVVGQSHGAESVALLLGSPTAVGRWNLPPIARLTPIHVACPGPAGFLAAAAQAVLPALPDERQVACLALAGLPEEEARSVYPQARILASNPAGSGEGAFFRAYQLIQARQPGKDGLALLAGAVPGAGLATLFEAL
jgi:hypothetical protein